MIISCEPCSTFEPGRLITLGNFRRALPPKTGYFHSRINKQHADAEGRVLCPLTATYITRDEAQLDHAYMGFAQVVHAFRVMMGWDSAVPTGIVSEPADGQLRASFVDAATREAFRTFHHRMTKAHIRVVKDKANLARAASQRAPRIPQPLALPVR